MTYEQMYRLALSKINPMQSGEYFSAGSVSVVLEAANGKYYTGVNIDLSCGLGFCAERSAAAAMIADGETVIRRVVCVFRDGSLWPPCGACREFISQLSPENKKTKFLTKLEGEEEKTLADFLPDPWHD